MASKRYNVERRSFRGRSHKLNGALISEIKDSPEGKPGTVYTLTIEFIGGLLEGLTHVSETTTYFKPGSKVLKPVAGSPYKVVSCVEVAS